MYAASTRRERGETKGENEGLEGARWRNKYIVQGMKIHKGYRTEVENKIAFVFPLSFFFHHLLPLSFSAPFSFDHEGQPAAAKKTFSLSMM